MEVTNDEVQDEIWRTQPDIILSDSLLVACQCLNWW